MESMKHEQKKQCMNMLMGERIYRDDDGGTLAIEWDLFESGRSIHPPSLPLQPRSEFTPLLPRAALLITFAPLFPILAP